MRLQPRAALVAAFVVAVSALSLAGCGRAGAKVQTAIDYYEHGAYEGALIKFRTMEAEEASLRTKTRARYLVYRGLAHWHMQERDEARRYLQEAQKALADGGDPKWLPSDVRAERARAEVELGLAPPAPPSTSGPPPAATSTGATPPPAPTPAAPAAPAATSTSDAMPPAAPPASPSSPTSSPPGDAPGQPLPPSTTPPADAM